MSFNNWDKLAKAQRDYPKAKAAVPFVEKQLKRNANNSYLLAWKADLALQRNLNAEEILTSLSTLLTQPGLTDVALLSYLYRLYFEAKQRCVDGGLGLNSIGQDALKSWQSAAKTLQRPNDRLALWNTLFKTALQEDAWEDSRFAILNYSKEAPPNKKHFHYILALANRLAADKKVLIAGKDDRAVQLLYTVALQYTKKAFIAPPEDPIAMKDIRDLRFMADMFTSQKRCHELFDLWKSPPQHLESLFSRQRDDVLAMMTRAAREQEDWSLLERHCIDTIDEKLSDSSEVGDGHSKIWELCAWNVGFWEALLSAVKATRPKQEGITIIKNQLDKIFGSKLKALDRPLRLTHMKLRQFSEEQMLPDCQEYFEHHAHLPSCFEDLRPFVTELSHDDQSEFLQSIRIRKIYSETAEGPTADELSKWLQAQFNLLKFEYLVQVSSTDNPTPVVLHGLIQIGLKLSQVWPDNSDIGYLVIYMLLNMHYRLICTDASKNPLEATYNSRLLLQATMYARHIVEKDKDKHNRTMALLATRLHLNLGLGTTGFRLYGHTKTKEMLQDTLSVYLLARISQTHPFTANTYGGFSAEDELGRVIGAIERMERKTEDFLLKDLPSFHWDSAVQSMRLKRRMNASLTKHLCIDERRRIARLKGESVEGLPSPAFKTFTDVSDHWDRTVFPNFEDDLKKHWHLEMVFPNAPPNWWAFTEQHFWRERTNKFLYREANFADFDPIETKYKGVELHIDHFSNSIRIEKRLRSFWIAVATILQHIHFPEVHKQHDAGVATLLLDGLKVMGSTLEKLRMPGDTNLAPEDEPTMFHENMLMACYGKMELCHAVNKLVEHIRDDVLQPKIKSKTAHPLKNKLPKNYDVELLKQTQICFNAIRDVAQSYIDLLTKRGVKAIVAQVRWGHTGELLKEVLSDDDVDYYAREYVESALEAWRGVLKVKLK